MPSIKKQDAPVEETPRSLISQCSTKNVVYKVMSKKLSRQTDMHRHDRMSLQ